MVELYFLYYLTQLYSFHPLLVFTLPKSYCVRRYSGVEPIVKTGSSRIVWVKDVVLEELGNITGVERISSKMKMQKLNAESIASSSLLFVANAYQEGGEKHLDPTTKEWITDLFAFQLTEEYDDHLMGDDGNDVLIGEKNVFWYLPHVALFIVHLDSDRCILIILIIIAGQRGNDILESGAFFAVRYDVQTPNHNSALCVITLCLCNNFMFIDGYHLRRGH